jgi:deoxycytidylate deaminase
MISNACPSPLKRGILQQAITVAMTSPSKKRLGSIILKKKKVVAAACNYDKKTHPIQKSYATLACKKYNDVKFSPKIYLHSEILCLIRARGIGDTIITARVAGHGGNKLRDSRPCPLCTLFLKEHGIMKIHYSTPNGFMYECWK